MKSNIAWLCLALVLGTLVAQAMGQGPRFRQRIRSMLPVQQQTCTGPECNKVEYNSANMSQFAAPASSYVVSGLPIETIISERVISTTIGDTVVVTEDDGIAGIQQLASVAGSRSADTWAPIVEVNSSETIDMTQVMSIDNAVANSNCNCPDCNCPDCDCVDCDCASPQIVWAGYETVAATTVYSTPVRQVVASQPVRQPVRQLLARQPVRQLFARQPVRQLFARQPVRQLFARRPLQQFFARFGSRCGQ